MSICFGLGAALDGAGAGCSRSYICNIFSQLFIFAMSLGGDILSYSVYGLRIIFENNEFPTTMHDQQIKRLFLVVVVVFSSDFLRAFCRFAHRDLFRMRE